MRVHHQARIVLSMFDAHFLCKPNLITVMWRFSLFVIHTSEYD